MSHTSIISTSSVTTTASAIGIVPAATAASAATAVKQHYQFRPAYEPGYTEMDSYAVDSRGEVRIVRPRPAISAGRGYRRGF